ncbi:MAG: hypothetical protein K2Y05_12375 [Hyphomicrobiaceae bacterium]|nr:hypothetical protein [Hyphomicrobiaceae bacterium]
MQSTSGPDVPITALVRWQTQFAEAQASRRVNVVCMKWGDRYSAMFVNRLFGMVTRNTSWAVRFVCFTDDPAGIRPEVECQPMPRFDYDPKLGKYWPKLGLMQADLGGLSGMTLFLDLDLVIVGNIDEMFRHPGRFLIIREWKDPHLGYGNSSVLRYFIGAEQAVIERFHATPHAEILGRYDGKEQNFLTKAVDEVAFWPPEWVPPFNHVCLSDNRVVRFFKPPARPPGGAKILVFYGSITPQSALRGEHEIRKRVRTGGGFRPTRRRFPPARWLAEYWRD